MRRRLARVRRDPAAKRQALKHARILLARAEAGDREAAEVLVDAIAHTGREELARDLLLVLQGREYVDGRVRNLDNKIQAQTFLHYTLSRVRRELFSPRAAPCIPSKKDLVRLVRDSNIDNERAVLRELRALLTYACRNLGGVYGETPVGDALRVANRILRGHGVEYTYVETRRGRGLSFDYVNTGDSYATTLLYDSHANRFRVTSWGDMVETWERRYGRAE